MIDQMTSAEKELRPSPEKSLAELVRKPVKIETIFEGKRVEISYQGSQADWFYYGGEEFRRRLPEEPAGGERLRATVDSRHSGSGVR